MRLPRILTDTGVKNHTIILYHKNCHFVNDFVTIIIGLNYKYSWLNFHNVGNFHCIGMKLPSASMTVVGEKSFEVYLKLTLLSLFEAYLEYQRLVLRASFVGSEMDSAKVNEIQCASAHEEQSVSAVKIVSGSKVVNNTALVGELELANSRKSVVDVSGVSQQIGVVFYSAFNADLLLSKL